MAPDAVVFPETTDEVSRILALCNASLVPIIPYGAGTSLEGQVQAVRGGVCIDLSRMDAVLQVSNQDLDCRVQAGVTREALNANIRDQGLFFPLDPGANATLGGMASTRASGTNAVRYGTMRELTLGLTVVTPEGKVIHTGGRARKSSAGYDLTRLYIGSEGTLGVITELQMRLFAIPEVIAAATCSFSSLDGAVSTVVEILQLGVPIARVELLDELQMRASISYSKLSELKAAPTLFMEFHGSPAAVDEQIGICRDVAAANGGEAFQWAKLQEERNRLWRARHDAYWAARSLAPGYESIATDACVPISHLQEIITESQAQAQESGLICPIVGHVGDGNFHMLILFDPADSQQARKAKDLSKWIARRAIEHGGTCTGEHGIGLHKLDLMAVEHGEAVCVMSSLKRALDPNNIMNPGKTVPLLFLGDACSMKVK
jgi:D-lactate dehydrogenase (cytochrome)